MRKAACIILTISLAFLILGIAAAATKGACKMTNFAINSSVFKNNEYLPKRYAGDGDNISPPLKFENVPKGTKSFVLIVDDPDAPMGTFNHWVVFNIPAKTKEFKEGKVPAGSIEGSNTAGEAAYHGPYPPPGKPHHYIFKIYALNAVLSLEAGSTKGEVEEAIGGHVLAHCILTGMYKR